MSLQLRVDGRAPVEVLFPLLQPEGWKASRRLHPLPADRRGGVKSPHRPLVQSDLNLKLSVPITLC